MISISAVILISVFFSFERLTGLGWDRRARVESVAALAQLRETHLSLRDLILYYFIFIFFNWIADGDGGDGAQILELSQASLGSLGDVVEAWRMHVLLQVPMMRSLSTTDQLVRPPAPPRAEAHKGIRSPQPNGGDASLVKHD